MRLFKGKGAEPLPADSTHKLEEGYIAANISIAKKPKYREVTVLIIDCVTGDTVYKSTFRTNARSDYAAHNIAMDLINAYAATEGLVLHDEPTSNAAMPYVRNVQKGSRW